MSLSRRKFLASKALRLANSAQKLDGVVNGVAGSLPG